MEALAGIYAKVNEIYAMDAREKGVRPGCLVPTPEVFLLVGPRYAPQCLMNGELVPWKMLSGSEGLGVLTPGWLLAEQREEKDGDAESGARIQVYQVAFANSFSSIPVLSLGLTGFDLDPHTGSRISLAAENICPHGFDVRITTWRDTRVYSVEFSWLAIGS